MGEEGETGRAIKPSRRTGRRNFLKGTAAGATVIALGGLGAVCAAIPEGNSAQQEFDKLFEENPNSRVTNLVAGPDGANLRENACSEDKPDMKCNKEDKLNSGEIVERGVVVAARDKSDPSKWIAIVHNGKIVYSNTKNFLPPSQPVTSK